MKSRIFTLALALGLSMAISASPSPKIYDLQSLSSEIELLLKKSNRTVEEGTTVTVFFSISEDNKIQYVAVASEDEEIADLLQKKLQDRQLDGKQWREGMIYELAVGYPEDELPLLCGRHS